MNIVVFSNCNDVTHRLPHSTALLVDLGVFMGIGNYYCVDGNNVYIDKEEVYGKSYWEEEGDFEELSFAYECLIELILENLPQTFVTTERKFLTRERLLIAESGMFNVTIVDWQSYFSLNIEVIDGLKSTPLARYHLDNISNRIFDLINRYYNLSIRTSAWTSGQRMSLDSLKAA